MQYFNGNLAKIPLKKLHCVNCRAWNHLFLTHCVTQMNRIFRCYVRTFICPTNTSPVGYLVHLRELSELLIDMQSISLQIQDICTADDSKQFTKKITERVETLKRNIIQVCLLHCVCTNITILVDWLEAIVAGNTSNSNCECIYSANFEVYLWVWSHSIIKNMIR